MNEPLIGYDSLVTPESVTASTAATGYPASNLDHPNTNEFWRAGTLAAQTVTFGVGEGYDYIGIARHNFARAGVTVSVEVSEDLVEWTSVVASFSPSADGVMLLRLAQSYTEPFLRISIGSSASIAVEMAVVYIGKILALPRRIYVGHTPIPYGRSTRITTGRSESGNFLGRIIVGERTSTAIDIQNVAPTYYRSTIDPWLKSTAARPFFFAWRPDKYPGEVAYVWATDDPSVANQRPNGMMQFGLSVTGIVPETVSSP